MPKREVWVEVWVVLRGESRSESQWIFGLGRRDWLGEASPPGLAEAVPGSLSPVGRGRPNRVGARLGPGAWGPELKQGRPRVGGGSCFFFSREAGPGAGPGAGLAGGRSCDRVGTDTFLCRRSDCRMRGRPSPRSPSARAGAAASPEGGLRRGVRSWSEPRAGPGAGPAETSGQEAGRGRSPGCPSSPEAAATSLRSSVEAVLASLSWGRRSLVQRPEGCSTGGYTERGTRRIY